MGKGNKSGLKEAFRVDEYGQLLLPAKVSNVKLSRIEHSKERGGCTRCYPHGPETDNATRKKNKRSWKQNRKTQYCWDEVL